MHPKEKQIFEMIRSCLTRLGADMADGPLDRVLAGVLSEVDPFLGFVMEKRNAATLQTIYSNFCEVRVMVRVGLPIPGCLSVFADLDLSQETKMEYDAGWGLDGLRFDECEQSEVLRLAYARLAEGLPSHHARLELISEIANSWASPPVLEIWDLLDRFPDQNTVDAACRMVRTGTSVGTPEKA